MLGGNGTSGEDNSRNNSCAEWAVHVPTGSTPHISGPEHVRRWLFSAALCTTRAVF